MLSEKAKANKSEEYFAVKAEITNGNTVMDELRAGLACACVPEISQVRKRWKKLFSGLACTNILGRARTLHFGEKTEK